MAVILIVDDDSNMRWALEKALKKDGYQIITKPDAASALQTVVEEIPDLILCDLKMPGMNGLEFLEALKTDHPQLPVIMITAYGDADTKRKALENGAETLFTKPIDFGALRSEIDLRVGRAA